MVAWPLAVVEGTGPHHRSTIGQDLHRTVFGVIRSTGHLHLADHTNTELARPARTASRLLAVSFALIVAASQHLFKGNVGMAVIIDNALRRPPGMIGFRQG